MKTAFAALALAAAFLAPAAAAAEPAPAAAKAEEARIPFVNFRGIRSFHAAEENVVYLQDQSRNWYRAELIGPCFGLTWANRIAVDTRGSSVFDRFSALIVDGERCQVHSLTRSAKPERRASRRNRRDGA